MLGTRFSDPDGRSVRNYTGMKTFRIPADATGYRTGPAVRADFSDQHALTRDLGVPVRTYLRLDTSTATLGLAAHDVGTRATEGRAEEAVGLGSLG